VSGSQLIPLSAPETARSVGIGLDYWWTALIESYRVERPLAPSGLSHSPRQRSRAAAVGNAAPRRRGAY